MGLNGFDAEIQLIQDWVNDPLSLLEILFHIKLEEQINMIINCTLITNKQ